MMMNIGTKIFSAINFLNIGAINEYLYAAVKIIGEKGYIVCLVKVKQ